MQLPSKIDLARILWRAQQGAAPEMCHDGLGGFMRFVLNGCNLPPWRSQNAEQTCLMECLGWAVIKTASYNSTGWFGSTWQINNSKTTSRFFFFHHLQCLGSFPWFIFAVYCKYLQFFVNLWLALQYLISHVLFPQLSSASSLGTTQEETRNEECGVTPENVRWGLTDSRGSVRCVEAGWSEERRCIICWKIKRWKTKKCTGKLASDMRTLYLMLSWHHHHQGGSRSSIFVISCPDGQVWGQIEWNTRYIHQANRYGQICAE